MEEKVDFKPLATTHEHRLRQLLICDNYRATVIVYCADCRQQINQYYEYLNNEQIIYCNNATSCNRTVS